MTKISNQFSDSKQDTNEIEMSISTTTSIPTSQQTTAFAKYDEIFDYYPEGKN